MTFIWTQQTSAGLRAWKSVASSADGSKLVAVDGNPGYIYTSINSGSTWTQQTLSGQRAWNTTASSSDGVKLVAGVNGSYIYTSTDSGNTWTPQTSSGSRNWSSIISSLDGIKLAAVAGYGYIITSTDSGLNWTSKTLAGLRNWSSITSSSNGIKLAAVDSSPGYIYTSTDSGDSWTQQTLSGSRSWRSITSSSDGTKLAATVDNDYIYTSTDSGSTWTQQTSTGTHSWRTISSSSNGTKLATTVSGNYIHTSIDSGSMWTTQTSAGIKNWYSITSSSDGSKLVAIDNNTGSNCYIYTGFDASLEETPPTISNGTLTPSDIQANQITLTWTKATDNISSQANLQYLVYYSINSVLDSVTNIETNGTAFGSYAYDINTQTVTGLSDSTTYYFNVIVKDQVGNKAAYTKLTQDTAQKFREIRGIGNYKQIDCSLDGSNIVALDGNQIIISNDYGLTWTTIVVR